MAYQISWSVTTEHHSLHKTLTISPDSGESNTPPLFHTTAKPMEKWNLQWSQQRRCSRDVLPLVKTKTWLYSTWETHQLKESTPAQCSGSSGKEQRCWYLHPSYYSKPESKSRHEKRQLQLNQLRQAKYYNRTTKELTPLAEGDTVRMKPFRPGEDRWKKA